MCPLYKKNNKNEKILCFRSKLFDQNGIKTLQFRFIPFSGRLLVFNSVIVCFYYYIMVTRCIKIFSTSFYITFPGQSQPSSYQYRPLYGSFPSSCPFPYGCVDNDCFKMSLSSSISRLCSSLCRSTCTFISSTCSFISCLCSFESCNC